MLSTLAIVAKALINLRVVIHLYTKARQRHLDVRYCVLLCTCTGQDVANKEALYLNGLEHTDIDLIQTVFCTINP